MHGGRYRCARVARLWRHRNDAIRQAERRGDVFSLPNVARNGRIYNITLAKAARTCSLTTQGPDFAAAKQFAHKEVVRHVEHADLTSPRQGGQAAPASCAANLLLAVGVLTLERECAALRRLPSRFDVRHREFEPRVRRQSSTIGRIGALNTERVPGSLPRGVKEGRP